MIDRDRALKGLWFRQGDPDLAKERAIASDLCYQFNNTHPNDMEKKKEIMKKLIGEIKGNFVVNAPFYCDYGSHIIFGNNFFANYNCKIVDGGTVKFGDDVRIAPNCSFMTVTHALDPEQRKAGYQIYKDITIGNNVWLGAGVTVLAGVSIGDNSVIGAGSVVSKDIPANVFACGVPCKVKRELSERDYIEDIDAWTD